MKVFISSTVYDLIDIRSELEVLMRDMGISPVLSDSATSDFMTLPDKNSIETCLVNLSACDEMIVILSSRYGPSLKQAGFEDISATHLEYHKAKKEGIPVHFYVRDRLESDYRTWKKNKGALDLGWVDNAKNYRLFEFITEHQKLVASRPQNNWYMTFRNSVELKLLIRRDLALPAAKASLERAIRENRVPIFEGIFEVEKRDSVYYCKSTFRNVGTVPAYNVTLDWVGKKKDISIPVIAPDSDHLQCFFWDMTSYSGSMALNYCTPEGHRVSDVFKVGFEDFGGNIKYGITLRDRIYRAGTEMPFKIEE